METSPHRQVNCLLELRRLVIVQKFVDFADLLDDDVQLI
jgi:hypothetical protein